MNRFQSQSFFDPTPPTIETASPKMAAAIQVMQNGNTHEIPPSILAERGLTVEQKGWIKARDCGEDQFPVISKRGLYSGPATGIDRGIPGNSTIHHIVPVAVANDLYPHSVLTGVNGAPTNLLLINSKSHQSLHHKQNPAKVLDDPMSKYLLAISAMRTVAYMETTRSLPWDKKIIEVIDMIHNMVWQCMPEFCHSYVDYYEDLAD